MSLALSIRLSVALRFVAEIERVFLAFKEIFFPPSEL